MTGSAKVLVTGASGFIGSAVLRQLVRAGYSVRALVRPTSCCDDLRSPHVEFTQGDLRDASSIRPASEGCRFLFHIAADYRLSSWDGDAIFAANVIGTRNLMEEALRAGIERIVYTSSVATLRCRQDGSSVDESDVLPVHEAIGAYKRSKIVAEQIVLDLVAKRGLPAVIVNPSTPIGPRDMRPTPTGKIIVAAASGQIPVYVDTGLNLVHVDDVAHGHLLALRYGRIGERYILGGQNVTFSDMLAKIADLIGRAPPRFKMPWYLALPVAACGEARAWVTKEEPLASWAGVRLSRHRMFFTSAKAEQELSFLARPYVTGLQDALYWFESNGYLRPRAHTPALTGRSRVS
jgi:dihydroflavonol-4-reductase